MNAIQPIRGQESLYKLYNSDYSTFKSVNSRNQHILNTALCTILNTAVYTVYSFKKLL